MTKAEREAARLRCPKCGSSDYCDSPQTNVDGISYSDCRKCGQRSFEPHLKWLRTDHARLEAKLAEAADIMEGHHQFAPLEGVPYTVIDRASAFIKEFAQEKDK